MRAMFGRLQDIYVRASGMHLLPVDECIERTLNLMDERPGVAIGEKHGDYAFANFVKNLIPQAHAKKGVRRLYVEMFQQRWQPMIDRWQDEGDSEEITTFINTHMTSYSQAMWAHYWDVMDTARHHGIRIIAMEPSRISPPFPGCEMYLRNDAWAKRISSDQKAHPDPYIVYCGRNHVTREGCNSWQPLHEMLGIRAVFMRRGAHGMAQAAGRHDVYNVWIPTARDQTAILGNGAVVAQSVPRQS